MSGGLAMMPSIQSTKQLTTANPLYGSPPSPLSSQPGMYGVHGMGAGMSAAAPAALAPAPNAQASSESEAAMLQQLMNEISRLKNELGN